MSMELYVISPKRLDTIQEWQKAVNEFQFPIKLSEDVDFEKLAGFCPCYSMENCQVLSATTGPSTILKRA